MTLSSMSNLPPVACVCGHLKRVHFGDGGPCLGAHRNAEGKELDATVCPCDSYEARST